MDALETQYVQSGEHQIAYRVVGEAGCDVLIVSKAAPGRIRGYRGAVRRLVRRINPITLLLWVLAAGMAALIVGEYVSQRL